MLARRVPSRLGRRIVGGGIAGLQRVRHSMGSMGLPAMPAVAEVARFGTEHDALWQRVSADYTCAVVRDASYLNWRYVGQPGQDYVRLEVRNGDDLLAIAVLLVREPGPVYQYRRGALVDLVVAPGNRAAVWAALEAVRLACVQRDVDLMVCDLIEPRLERELTRFGFVRREAERVFLVSVPDATGTMASALSPDAWLVTGGDSDIDRPW
jgi:hypothetical protein